MWQLLKEQVKSDPASKWSSTHPHSIWGLIWWIGLEESWSSWGYISMFPEWCTLQACPIRFIPRVLISEYMKVLYVRQSFPNDCKLLFSWLINGSISSNLRSSERIKCVREKHFTGRLVLGNLILWAAISSNQWERYNEWNCKHQFWFPYIIVII